MCPSTCARTAFGDRWYWESRHLLLPRFGALVIVFQNRSAHNRYRGRPGKRRLFFCSFLFFLLCLPKRLGISAQLHSPAWLLTLHGGFNRSVNQSRQIYHRDSDVTTSCLFLQEEKTRNVSHAQKHRFATSPTHPNAGREVASKSNTRATGQASSDPRPQWPIITV